jgi:aryl-phospho-beta-D-glucosidase BglC (GH1 family)
MVTRYKISILLIVAAFTCYNLPAQLTPQNAVKQMARGINIGNTMDCPTEGSWGNGLIQETYFDDYKNAGFTSVRIPITWDGHTLASSPYTINATWMTRVKQVVDWGLARGLLITINAHHEAWLKSNYTDATKRARFDSIWSQISETFKNYSDSLIFEIINEPKGLTSIQINDLNARILSIIRKTNPTRLVIFSGNEWANSDQLVAAAIPDTADHHLVGYYHSYDPYPFGLTGAGSYGSTADKNATKAKFDQVTTWSNLHHIPVILSEFGAIDTADYNSRMIYYATVVEQALVHGVAFNAWDDGGYFGIFIRPQNSWNEIKDIIIYTYKESPTLLKAAITNDKTVTLSWTNRTTQNDSIMIDRKTLSTNFALLAKTGPTEAQYVDTTAKNYDTVIYRLRTRLKDSIDLYSYPFMVRVVPNIIDVVDIQHYQKTEIFPNPSTDAVTISIKDGEIPADLDLFDLTGNHIRSIKMNNPEMTINVSGLQEGAYFIKVTSPNTTSVKRVIIRH